MTATERIRRHFESGVVSTPGEVARALRMPSASAYNVIRMLATEREINVVHISRAKGGRPVASYKATHLLGRAQAFCQPRPEISVEGPLVVKALAGRSELELAWGSAA